MPFCSYGVAELFGTYGGIVENVDDPEKLGRIKVRVPAVYGASGSLSGFIGTNDLPWALPAGMPAGGTSASGGLSHLPAPGDRVWVRFLDGEPEKPIWEWGMQTKDQAKVLKLHSYKQTTGKVGAPDRTILTRFGHSLEINEKSATLTTKEGYQVRLDGSNGDTGGTASLQTPAGQKVVLDDVRKTGVIQCLERLAMSAGNVLINAASKALIRAAGSLTVMVGGTLAIVKEKSIIITTGTGASIIVDDTGNITAMSAGGASVSTEGAKVMATSPNGTGLVIEDSKVSVTANQMVINTQALAIGTDAVYPLVMMTPEMLVYLTTHTHTNGNNGSPTGPPITTNPLFAQQAQSTRVKAT